MGWVKEALIALKKNQICSIRPIGNSMKGIINSGQLITLQSIDLNKIYINDIVFINWKKNYILHIIKDITDEQVLIGNNLGKLNGWISKKDIIAKVIAINI